jgi:Secretion system C-terminal sorting domain
MRNFIFKQVFLLLLTFFYAFSVKAQTATGGCSSVSVTNDGGGYPTNTFFSGNGFANCSNTNIPTGCCRLVTGNPTEARFILQRKGTNGSFTNVAGPQVSGVFTGLSHGTFRVEIEVPRVHLSVTPQAATNCPGGVTCINQSGQVVGLWGQWDPNKRLTNEVVVGATLASEVQFTFADNNGTNSNNLAFDANEVVGINTNCQNYDRYWLAIYEQSGQKRSWSQGWTFTTTMPSYINLSQKWGTSHGGFTSLGSYYVQFAAMSNCNSSWVEATNTQGGGNTFFVCPTGSGCKVAKNLDAGIHPNPVSSSFRLSNLDSNIAYALTLTDISGRIIKSLPSVSESEEVEVSDIPDGLYFAHLFDGAKKLQTIKVSVVK